MLPEIGVPQNGWFIMQNLIKIDDFGVYTPIFGNTHILVLLIVSWYDGMIFCVCYLVNMIGG